MVTVHVHVSVAVGASLQRRNRRIQAAAEGRIESAADSRIEPGADGRIEMAVNGCVQAAADDVADAVAGVLVDFEGVDLPVGVLECSRVVLDVVLAGAGERRAGGIGAPDSTGPVTAEGGVEDLNRVTHVSKCNEAMQNQTHGDVQSGGS